MKRIITSVAAALMVLTASAQFGFGGQQITVEDMHSSQKFADINYAGDNEPYHTMDIYLPDTPADKYPVVVHIYGSAWFSNNGKGMADLGTICTALLKAGYAVVCPNHRASGDAKWPAQGHDIKAVVRYLRANADKYKLDPDFIATSGFSSGGHLSSFMQATSGTASAVVGNETIDLEGNVGDYTGESSKINAAVSWSGPVDLQAMDCGGRPDGVKGSPEEFLVGVPYSDATADLYKSVSSTTYADAGDPPILAFHGTADNVVPYCQAEAWIDTYKTKGVDAELITVEDGGHGFNMYSDDNLLRMVNFLNQVRNSR